MLVRSVLHRPRGHKVAIAAIDSKQLKIKKAGIAAEINGIEQLEAYHTEFAQIPVLLPADGHADAQGEAHNASSARWDAAEPA